MVRDVRRSSEGEFSKVTAGDAGKGIARYQG
jgi:hypothetical protein